MELNVTSVDEGLGERESVSDAEERVRQAERQVTVMSERLEEMRKSSEQIREEIEALERRREIELALQKAGTVDMETARLLMERDLGEEKEPDVEGTVRALRHAKPHLFRAGDRSGVRAPVLAGERESGTGPVRERAAAAEEVARTGHRGALLRYLRARRAGV